MKSSPLGSIINRMRESGMLAWIGNHGSETTGKLDLDWLLEKGLLHKKSRVLDFGCGIGRASVFVSDYLRGGKLVGIDIVPRMVHFCQTEIGGAYPNSEFYLFNTNNNHYRQFGAGTAELYADREEFANMYHGYFNLITAYSVFTHLTPDQALVELHFLRRVVKPDARFVFTVFLSGRDNKFGFRLAPGQGWGDMYGNNPNCFCMFELEEIKRLMKAAGWNMDSLSLGSWPTDDYWTAATINYQDILVASPK